MLEGGTGPFVFNLRLLIFSGMPDPEWTLSEQQVADFLARYTKLNQPSAHEPPGEWRGLGYAGLELRVTATAGESRVYVDGAVVDSADHDTYVVDTGRDLERWLLNTAPGNAITPDITDEVRKDLESPLDWIDVVRERTTVDRQCSPCGGAKSPAYLPDPWNIATVRRKNNCYNYANDAATHTYAQPGRGSGHAFAPPASCDRVSEAAERDGLLRIPTFEALADGFFVALVVKPGQDYHWYRQDNTGCWSHKPGTRRVRNYDNNGNRIADPRTCSRDRYSIFCSYMISNGAVTIA